MKNRGNLKMQVKKFRKKIFKPRLHHTGLLVEDIETYLKKSFWRARSPIVYDPIQKCRLCLVSIQADDDQFVELVQPVGQDSPVYRSLKSDQKLHHLCFEMTDTETADEYIREYRLLPMTKWQPATLFKGRLIRFAYTSHREIVEFLIHGKG
jgi:hypothetical protein